MSQKKEKRVAKSGESRRKLIFEIIGALGGLVGIFAFFWNQRPTDLSTRIEQIPIQFRDDDLVKLVSGDAQLRKDLGPSYSNELYQGVVEQVNQGLSQSGTPMNIVSVSFLRMRNGTDFPLYNLDIRGEIKSSVGGKTSRPFEATLPALGKGDSVAICFEVQNRGKSWERVAFENANVTIDGHVQALKMLDTSTVSYPILKDPNYPGVVYGYPPRK